MRLFVTVPEGSAPGPRPRCVLRTEPRPPWGIAPRSGAVALAVVLVLATVACGGTPIARADAPACPEEPPDDGEVIRRLDWIERAIDRDEDDVRRWFSAFVVVHTLLGAAHVALAFGADVGANVDQEAWWHSPAVPFLVNATGSTLGLVTLLLSTPPILGAGDFVRSLPRATPAQRHRSLREAERRIQRDHDAAAFVRGPLASVASALYVGAASTALVLLGHTLPALLHALGGSLLAQGRLLLHPTGPIDAWRRYALRHPDAACDPVDAVADVETGPRVAVVPTGFGASLTLTF